MMYRGYRGKVAYMIEKDGKLFERGREWFSVTRHDDGQRTLRAQCEIDNRTTHREVIYTVNAEFEPIDCFIRLHKHGKFMGSGWCRFDAREAQCEVFNAQLGRVRQVVALPEPARGFGSHPINADAMLMKNFDHRLPDRIQPVRSMYISSLEHDGASGPMILPIDFSIEYLGRERVSTAVGEFDTDHYRLLVDGTFPEAHPTEEIWCLPWSCQFIKAYVGGYMQTTFELVELSGDLSA